jgi:sugar (pentulose or hexulose) kinase
MHTAAMNQIPVIAIFDMGKTNKKLFLFDESYHVVFERSARLEEISDEDGFPCEDIELLKRWLFDSMDEISQLRQFDIKAVNFSAYGASMVYLDENGNYIAPLYNYLKPYPGKLEDQFYSTYGGKENFSVQTASPALGSLNSGLQLYRIKYENPDLFKRIKYALHLPQYLSYLLSGEKSSDMTSIGCHTALWNFTGNNYHEWVEKEGMIDKLAPIRSSTSVTDAAKHKIGVGLHDSSAALIPYLMSFKEPFVLLSTGTWSISLNPFIQSPLTTDELKNDCLNYIQYNGRPVKASRFFIGHYHDDQLNKIASGFGSNVYNYSSLSYDSGQSKWALLEAPDKEPDSTAPENPGLAEYFQLMQALVKKQKLSTDLVITHTDTRQIFVDGGFSQNDIFMHILAASYPEIKVYAASIPQSTALGAALSIHGHWNRCSVPRELIELKHFPAPKS